MSRKATGSIWAAISTCSSALAEGVSLFFEPPQKALTLSDPKARFCDSVPRKLFDLPAVLRAPLRGEGEVRLSG